VAADFGAGGAAKPRKLNRARIRVQKAYGHADGGRFSRAVWPQQTEDLAWLDVQRKPINRDEVGEGLSELAET